MDIDFYVAIATAGRIDLLERTLKSLVDCNLPAGYRGAFVIENGGRRGAEEVVRSFNPRWNIQYSFREAGTKSAALNSGVSNISSGFVFFTDADVRFHSGALQHFAQGIETQSSTLFYGGAVEVVYEETPPDWLIDYLPHSAKGWSPSDDRDLERSLFLGCNWGAFAEDLNAAGGFDVSKGPGASNDSLGEEADIQRRLLQAGFSRRYIPDAIVSHYVPKDRCSMEWALDRSFRKGVESGISKGHRNKTSYPIKIGISTIRKQLHSTIALWNSTTELQFRRKWLMEQYKGGLHGWRLSRSANA